MDTVGERIKAIRQERGVTVRELAQSVALAPSTLYDLEQGDSAGTPKLPAIARALGVSAYWLQTGKGKRDSSMEPIAVADGPKPGYWTIPRFDVFMQMGGAKKVRKSVDMACGFP